MFCNHCGSELSAGISMCPKCGKMVAGAWPEAAGRRPLTSHLSLLVVFWYVLGVLRAIPTVVLILVGFTAGAALRSVNEPIARIAGPGLFFCLAIVIGICAMFSLLTAWGLQARRPWARTMALVMGILSLLNIPFGTALGIYTLVVLLPEPARTEYEKLAAEA